MKLKTGKNKENQQTKIRLFIKINKIDKSLAKQAKKKNSEYLSTDLDLLWLVYHSQILYIFLYFKPLICYKKECHLK